MTEAKTSRPTEAKIQRVDIRLDFRDGCNGYTIAPVADGRLVTYKDHVDALEAVKATVKPRSWPLTKQGMADFSASIATEAEVLRAERAENSLVVASSDELTAKDLLFSLDRNRIAEIIGGSNAPADPLVAADQIITAILLQARAIVPSPALEANQQQPAMSDHARGCQGREYTCTCGYDEANQQVIETLRAAIKLTIPMITADNILDQKAKGDLTGWCERTRNRLQAALSPTQPEPTRGTAND